MTQRLFFTSDALSVDIDVIDCTPCEDGFVVTLQATPFHPQGGGQPCDTGRIGNSEVLKVLQLQDSIAHYVTQAIEPGPARADYLMHIREASAHFVNITLSIGVVGVGANKDMIVFVVERGRRQLGHIADDARFIPCRNHNR